MNQAPDIFTLLAEHCECIFNIWKNGITTTLSKLFQHQQSRHTNFFFNGDNKENNTKTSFGFKSRSPRPPCTELERFEKDLINIIKSVKFTNIKNSFQKKPRADITEITSSRNTYVFADKTNNVYRMPTSERNKLLKENVNKTYKKGREKLQKSINLEGKSIATKLKLSDRIEKLGEAPALKDHKENFRSKPSC